MNTHTHARPWSNAVACATRAKAYDLLPSWERESDIRDTLAETFGPEGLAALDPDHDPGEATLYASPWGTQADRYQDQEPGSLSWAMNQGEDLARDRARLVRKWGLPYGRPLSGTEALETAKAWQASQACPWSPWQGRAVQGW